MSIITQQILTSHSAPGYVYIETLINYITANSAIVLDIVGYIVAALCIFICIVLERYKKHNKAIKSISLAICAVALLGFALYGSTSALLGIFVILVAAFQMFRYYDMLAARTLKKRNIIPLGISIGILALLRQDMASYMYGLFFWAMFWAGMADVEGMKLPLLKRAILGFRDGVIFTIVVVIIAAPIYIYLICNYGASHVYTQLVSAPMAKYGSIFSLNFGTHIILADIVPILIALSALALLIFRKTSHINSVIFWKEMLFINLTLNIFNYAALVQDIIHLLPALCFSAMLLPSIFEMKRNGMKLSSK
jgi:hypothetical protein